MSPSLPVPSKAALTALRGLVLGTSCTIALLTEDRRRRINRAVRAIENGERVRSAKNYRIGGGAFALALEEEALLEDGLFPWTSRQQSISSQSSTSSPTISSTSSPHYPDRPSDTKSQSQSQTRRDDDTFTPTHDGKIKNSRQQTTTTTTTALTHPPRPNQTAPEQPHLILPPLNDQLHKIRKPWPAVDPKIIEAYAFPTNDKIINTVQEAYGNRDSLKLSTAVQHVLEAIKLGVAPDNTNKSWVEATALLCRACQEETKVEEALEVLSQMVARGPMEESEYFAYEPLKLIETLLARGEGGGAEGATKETLDLAIRLFLPTFVTKPNVPNGRVFELGERLLRLSFATGRLNGVVNLFWRCTSVAQENPYEFTGWVISMLEANSEYKLAVRLFLTCFCKMSPDAEATLRIGDALVRSVEGGHNHKPARVLKALLEICSGTEYKLKTVWVIKLLSAHWKRHQNFEEFEALFEHVLLKAADLREIVFNPDGVYRVMIEVALEAGQEVKAELYFAEAVAKYPELATDTRLLCVFARYSAKVGDWDGVRAKFESMKLDAKTAFKASDALASIVKCYAKAHTVRETEVFLRSFIDDHKVPLSSHMVTLMANQYGSLRDFQAFIKWIEYCVEAGFKVDGAFSNAILVNCRRRWNFPFRELRTLFRKLRVLNPDFVDKHTERVMVNAALSDSKYGGPAARGRVLSLRVDINRLPARGKCASDDDVFLSMKEALTYGRAGQAIGIYKRALHLGLPYSSRSLRLAVQAQLMMPGKSGGFEKAYELLHKAQAKGHDVDDIIKYMLLEKFKGIRLDSGAFEVFEVVQKVLHQFKSCGIKLSDRLLHRAAQSCLMAGHLRGAVLFAQQAAETRGYPRENPCYNLASFRILLPAYAGLVNVDGVRRTITKALSNYWREDTNCLKTLKHSRTAVIRSCETLSEEDRMQALAAIEAGIEAVKDARTQLRQESGMLDAELVRIMRQAALDANCAPVDFADVPWLGGGPRIRDDEAAEDEEDELIMGAGEEEMAVEVEKPLASAGVAVAVAVGAV